MKRRAALAKESRPKRQKVSPNQLATTQMIVRQELRKKTDWKYTDHGQASQNMTAAGTVVSLLSNLTRGDAGTDNFEGNIVRPQAITLKYFCHTNEARNCFRVLIFQWFDSSVPNPADVLQNVASPFGPVSPVNVTNKSYVKILYDRTMQFAPTASDGAGNIVGEAVFNDTVYIPGKRLRQVRYNATANVPQDGCLYVMYISDDVLPPHPQITWYGRVTFADQ